MPLRLIVVAVVALKQQFGKAFHRGAAHQLPVGVHSHITVVFLFNTDECRILIFLIRFESCQPRSTRVESKTHGVEDNALAGACRSGNQKQRSVGKRRGYKVDFRVGNRRYVVYRDAFQFHCAFSSSISFSISEIIAR